MRKQIAFLAAAALVAGGVAAPAAAQRGRNAAQGEQAMAREEMQAGREMSSRDIERRIVPQMRDSDYLGFEYDPGASAYRLKFLKDGQVTWVDVDARTGRVLRVSR
ncbi:MAG TPA: PepSY domain-containing protein [Croceibacterium sp.]